MGWCLLSRSRVVGGRGEQRPDASVTLQPVAGLAVWTTEQQPTTTAKTTILRGPGGRTKFIQVICDDLWRWVESHQAMGGCERCESPPNNKKLRHDESTMVDSQSCMSWVVFSCPSARLPVWARLAGPRSGKVGTGAPATTRKGCALLAGGVYRRPEAGRCDPINRSNRSSKGTSHNASPHPPRAVTYQSVKQCRVTCRAFPAGPIRRLTSPVEFD